MNWNDKEQVRAYHREKQREHRAKTKLKHGTTTTPEQKEHRKTYREEKREDINYQKRSYYQEHKNDPAFKAQQHAASKRWRQNHKEQHKQTVYAWRAKNRDEITVRQIQRDYKTSKAEAERWYRIRELGICE